MLDFITDYASWGWKDIEWTTNGKIVVPDPCVDKFSVQSAKAVSKLCSNHAYFYDQSWHSKELNYFLTALHCRIFQ